MNATEVGLSVAGLAAIGLALRAVAALRASAGRTRRQAAQIDAIFSGMVDGILVVDGAYRVVRWNDRFPEIAGVPLQALRPGAELGEVLRAQAEAGEFGAVDIEAEVSRRLGLFQTGGNLGTVERVRPNGDVMELRRSPLEGGGFVTLYTDITLRRRAEDQLRQAQKMEAVGQLTSGIVHDFNNLLSVVHSCLDLAGQTLKRGDLGRVERHLDAARAGALRAATLTHRLLAFARQQDLDPAQIEVNQIVAGMSDLIRQSIGSGNVLEARLATDLWPAVADTNQLENALLNLAVNARDAIGQGGVVTVQTANTRLEAADVAGLEGVAAGEFVMIAVSDDGKGMSSAEASRAFEPFFTTKPAGEGSGLGLSQVFGFVKQSLGHVRIDSEPGMGTTVRLFLPRATAEAAAAVSNGAYRGVSS